MPSERVQRQIDRLLDEAEQAIATRDWTLARDLCDQVLTLDAENADARSFFAIAERRVDTESGPGAAPPLLRARNIPVWLDKRSIPSGVG